jgi:hypothetical protein
MPALDALFLKNILASDLESSTIMAEILQRFINTSRGDKDASETADSLGLMTPISQPGMFSAQATGAQLRADMRRYLEASYAYYVSEKMMPLVTAASESMPEEVLLTKDLPSEYGFMLIPGGISTIDVRGALLKYNAVLWTTFGGTVRVYWMTDKYDMQDSSNMFMRLKADDAQWASLPRLTIGHITDMTIGEALPQTYGPTMVLPPEVSQGMHFIRDEKTGSVSIAIEDKGYSPEELVDMVSGSVRTDPASRWLLTVWRLMQQTITSVEQESAPRSLKKQLQRRNLDTEVSVIGLRHKAVKGEGDTEVEWSHRWLVKGHWRKQPTKEGIRLVWIHPYIKGPENKPLLIREHVYALVR